MQNRSILLFISFFLSLSLFSQEERVTLHMEDVTRQEVLDWLEANTAYRFVFRREKVNVEQRVNIRVHEASLEDLLKELFAGEPVTFHVTEKKLVIISSDPDNQPRSMQSTIRGLVTDEKNKPLSGATVQVEGTSIGAITQLEGTYVLRNLSEGAVTLEVSYIGYQTERVSDTLIGNIASEMNFSLVPWSFVFEEVVVTGQARGQYAAINQQVSSGKVTNVVASDKIREVPDVNAAESIARLPGISIQRSNGEGDRVVIRGLSPRFNVITVDGIRLPPDGAGDRSTGLSFLSSDMLEGIEVSKSMTADMDADALGGTVNLKLREALGGFHTSLKALGAYGDMSNSLSDYSLTGSVSNRFLDNRLGVLFLANVENRARNSDNYSAGYSDPVRWFDQDAEGVNVDSGYNIYTDKAFLTEHLGMVGRKGGTLMLDYRAEHWTIKLKNMVNLQHTDNMDRSNYYDFVYEDELTQTVSESHWNKRVLSHTLSNHFTLLGTSLQIDLSYVSMRNRGDLFESVYADKDAVQDPKDFSYSNRLYRDPVDLIAKVLVDSMHQANLVTMGSGDHVISDENIIIRADWKIPFAIGERGAGYLKAGGKVHRTNRSSDKDYSGIDFRHGLGGYPRDALFVEFPGFITAAELPGYRDVDGVPAINFIDEDYDWGEFMEGQYTSALGWTIDHDLAKEVHHTLYAKYNHLYFRNMNAFNQDYQVVEQLAAGYVLAELNLLNNRLMLLPGVRFEQKRSHFVSHRIVLALTPTGYSQIDRVKSDRVNSHIFPSINAKLRLAPTSHIHLAAYKAAARPGFMDITPMAIIPEQTGWFAKQNPLMEPAIAWNFDMAYSLYSKYTGLFTINGFFKQIEGLTSYIEYEPFRLDHIVGLPGEIMDHLIGPEYFEGILTGDPTIYSGMPFNSGYRSTVKGIEVSLQTNFRYLPGVLSGVVLDLNAAFISSERRHDYLNRLGITTDTLLGIPVLDTYYFYDTRTARFVDQPDLLFNGRIGYEFRGFSAHLSFRYQKNAPSWIDTQYSLRDSYIDDLFQVDFAMRQRISRHLYFMANVQNITRFMDEHFMDPGNGVILPTSSQYYGRSFQAGILLHF
ncbi:MAG: carboxypeptidase-like regulatory domain-containing protein [Bacteroidota bacterium]